MTGPVTVLWRAGTMIHHQVGTWSNEHLFEFRFNDVSAEGVNLRRTQRVPGFGSRTVYNVKIPTVKVPVFEKFPFQVTEVRALIELSTMTYRDDQVEYQIRLVNHKL